MNAGAPGAAGLRIVLASDNRGKLAEMRALLGAALPRVELVAQGALGIAPAPEPHETFLENALAKARHAARASGLPAVADDSGLCCAALGGAPGVRSARLAGEPSSDAANNAALLALLRGQADRRAHYRCVIVALRAPSDPEPLVAEGLWHGLIVDAPAGEGGFGYDPHFLLPELGRTVAQLEAGHKNVLSHRGIAMRAIVARMGESWNIR